MSDVAWRLMDSADKRVIALKLAVDSLTAGHGGISNYSPSITECLSRSELFLDYIERGNT